MATPLHNFSAQWKRDITAQLPVSVGVVLRRAANVRALRLGQQRVQRRPHDNKEHVTNPVD